MRVVIQLDNDGTSVKRAGADVAKNALTGLEPTLLVVPTPLNKSRYLAAHLHFDCITDPFVGAGSPESSTVATLLVGE